jgi:proteasome lid subunit RPN8/RPN11
MSTLIVTRAVYDAMRAHGEETYPHECCGALLGIPEANGWRVMESIRAGNTRTD